MALMLRSIGPPAERNVGASIACPVCEANNRPKDDPSLMVGFPDLPAANCIRSECRTNNARPYAASREECRDAHCAQKIFSENCLAAKLKNCM